MANKNKVDAWAQKADKHSVFEVISPDPDNKLSILDAMRAHKNSEEEAQNRTLQMQVHCLVEQLTNPDASTSASKVSPVSPAAATPTASSTAASRPILQNHL